MAGGRAGPAGWRGGNRRAGARRRCARCSATPVPGCRSSCAWKRRCSAGAGRCRCSSSGTPAGGHPPASGRSARLAATLAAAWSPKLISGWPLRLSRMLRCRPLWATSWSCRACACTAGSLRRSRSSSRLWRICSSFNCRFSRSRASSSRPRFQCAIAPSARASSAPRAPTSRARRSDSRPGGVIGALPGRSRRREWYGSA